MPSPDDLTPMKPVHLRTLRERRGLTQEQLAEASDVAQNTISKLERHPQSRPVFETVAALARALHWDPRYLRFGPDRHHHGIDGRSAVARRRAKRFQKIAGAA